MYNQIIVDNKFNVMPNAANNRISPIHDVFENLIKVMKVFIFVTFQQAFSVYSNNE